MNNFKVLMQRREEIAFELIEANQEYREELTDELLNLESQLELMTGKTIEELEVEFYKEY